MSTQWHNGLFNPVSATIVSSTGTSFSMQHVLYIWQRPLSEHSLKCQRDCNCVTLSEAPKGDLKNTILASELQRHSAQWNIDHCCIIAGFDDVHTMSGWLYWKSDNTRWIAICEFQGSGMLPCNIFVLLKINNTIEKSQDLDGCVLV